MDIKYSLCLFFTKARELTRLIKPSFKACVIVSSSTFKKSIDSYAAFIQNYNGSERKPISITCSCNSENEKPQLIMYTTKPRRL